MSSSSSDSPTEEEARRSESLLVKDGLDDDSFGGGGDRGMALARGLSDLTICQDVELGGFMMPRGMGAGGRVCGMAVNGGGSGQAGGFGDGGRDGVGSEFNAEGFDLYVSVRMWCNFNVDGAFTLVRMWDLCDPSGWFWYQDGFNQGCERGALPQLGSDVAGGKRRRGGGSDGFELPEALD